MYLGCFLPGSEFNKLTKKETHSERGKGPDSLTITVQSCCSSSEILSKVNSRSLHERKHTLGKKVEVMEFSCDNYIIML